MVDGEDGSGDVTPAPREHTTLSTTRRDVIRSIGARALGAAFAAGASPAAAQMAQGHPEVQPGTPPLQGVRVIERSAVLSGRLAGLLLADQGAEVFVERGTSITPGGLDDNFFDRGKIAVPPGAGADAASTDLVIVDGTAETARTPHQVLVRFMAALPGDEAYGYLPLRLQHRGGRRDFHNPLAAHSDCRRGLPTPVRCSGRGRGFDDVGSILRESDTWGWRQESI